MGGAELAVSDSTTTSKPPFPPNTQIREGDQPPKTTSVPLPVNVTVRREIDRLARQTEGISKALKRLKESV